MKTTRFTPLPLLLAGLVLGAGFVPSAQAQPATTAKPKRADKATKADKPATPAAKKPRAKNLTARMVSATEAAMGKALTPEAREQLTTALRAREAAIQEANRVYYEAFAQTTGLTPEQAQEIDKPTRGTTAKTADGDMKKTDMTQLTTDDDNEEGTPTTPK